MRGADLYQPWVARVTDSTRHNLDNNVASVIHLTGLHASPDQTEAAWRITSAARARLIELDDLFDAREDARLEMTR